MKTKLFYLFVLAISLLIVQCDGTKVGQETVDDFVDVQTLIQGIDDVLIDPVSDDEYRVTVIFNPSMQNHKMPDGLLISGFPELEPLYRSPDNNLNYSVVTKNKKIEDIYFNMSNDTPQNAIQSFGCKVSFSLPDSYDKNCDDFCPRKSLLGGKTLFCVCLYDCWWDNK